MRGAFFEALAVCHGSNCYANFAKGNRIKRICRRCPMPYAFRTDAHADDAVAIVDIIRALYHRLGIRGQSADDNLGEFFERFVHSSVIATVREQSKRLPNGLLDPKDMDFHGAGTLIAMLMDDLADGHNPRFGGVES